MRRLLNLLKLKSPNSIQEEQDLRTDNVNTVIATIGSNPKSLEIGNEYVSPKEVKFPEFQAEIGRIWYPEGSWQLLAKHRRSIGV